MKRPPASIQWLAIFAAGAAFGIAMTSRDGKISALSLASTNSSPPPIAETKAGEESEIQAALAQSYEKFRSIDAAFELAARSVAPCVVHIVARKNGPVENGEVVRFEESGSGLIIRPAGVRGLFVLTNHHVVAGAIASEIRISLHDGQVIHPERFWADDKTDVAVLKIAKTDLPSATLGNSDDARVGTWVLALGSPFGLSKSVSQGIISARGRHEDDLEADGVEHQEFLQTDAAINPGNSGGPLVNLKGQVIGINTAIASEGGGNEGVGFSIPINLAKWAMEQLINEGRVRRGALGVNLQELSPQTSQDLGLDRPRGARIVAVRDRSPAALAGFLPGDVVLKFNGVEVLNHNHLINLVSMTPIGQTAEVIVWRNKAALQARLTIADRDHILSQQASKENGRTRQAQPSRP